MMLMADDASNSALHAAGYLRPDQREVNQRRFLPPVAQRDQSHRPAGAGRGPQDRQRHPPRIGLPRRAYTGKMHVELAREAKKSFDERRANPLRQRRPREGAGGCRQVDRGLRRVDQADAGDNEPLSPVEGAGANFARTAAQKISPAQLFNGEADVDHILPRWRSLDDSMANKVVAHRRCNAEKGDRTPREWLEDSDPERYERACMSPNGFSYGKQRKFQQKDIELDDFVQRQFNDTAYISRCVSQYLRCLGAKVVCTRGDMTADVRYWWGLNSILQPDGSDRKNRDDHRHHAIDALVIALTDEKRLFALANARGENMPPPWEGFREEAERLILGINVSHRAQTRPARCAPRGDILWRDAKGPQPARAPTRTAALGQRIGSRMSRRSSAENRSNR